MIIINPDIPNIHELEPDLRAYALNHGIEEEVFDWRRPDGRVLVRIRMAFIVKGRRYEHNISEAILEAYNTLHEFLSQDFASYKPREGRAEDEKAD